MGQTVLVIEDDPDTRNIVEFFLTRDGWQVETANNGSDALLLHDTIAPDLVILDLNLPEVDGLEICRRIRRDSDTPVIMLTARQADQDKLTGFDTGADDYLSKPFNPMELVARVRALWRRAKPDLLSAEQTLAHGGVTVDVAKHEVTVHGQPVAMTPTELRILITLLKTPGRVVSRQELLSQAYGNSYERDERTIEVHVSNLRRKLTGALGHSQYIRAVYGRGYKLAEEA